MHIEDIMYQVSNLFLTPVLFLIGLLFVYSFFALGTFTGQWFQRRKYLQDYRQIVHELLTGNTDSQTVKGYRLFNHFQRQPTSTPDYLDLLALKELEASRIITRIAPMLGLVGTMIPMGPALKSLADGNVQGISENLIVAFAAVTFGLVTASITFCLASIHKRWLASELHDIQMIQQARRPV
ncbi:MAG: MotA/TolQ/ExbB proton channel family protein [Nitrospirales bacterium]